MKTKLIFCAVVLFGVVGQVLWPQSKPETVTSTGVTTSVLHIVAPEIKDPDFKVEKLTEAESKELKADREAVEKAQAVLNVAESKVRLGHGEDIRYIGAGFYLTTLECRGSRTTVELRGDWALITTEYANGGCF